MLKIKKNLCSTYIFAVVLSIACFHSLLQARTLTIGMCSEWGKKSGIAEYSEHVKDALTHAGNKVVKIKHDVSTSEIEQIIKKHTIDVVCIQYLGLWNRIFPGFKERCRALVRYLQQKNFPRVIIAHCESHADTKTLSMADGIIVHAPPRLLKKPQTVYFPHPCPIWNSPSAEQRNALRKKYGYTSDDIILTTTGFLHPRKKVPEVLTALVPHLKKYKNIHLQLLTAKQISREKSRVESIIKGSNLQKRVTFITDFLPQEVIQERLWMADIAFRWDGMQKRSGSGIENQFISSRIPAVLNTSSQFTAPPGTVTTPSSTRLFAKKLIDLAQNRDDLVRLRQLVEESYQTYNYNAMVHNYLDIFHKALQNKASQSLMKAQNKQKSRVQIKEKSQNQPKKQILEKKSEISHEKTKSEKNEEIRKKLNKLLSMPLSNRIRNLRGIG